MKTLLVATLAVACVAAHARSETVSDQNASLKLTIDEPTASPVLPRKVEWFVDGRRILVYPSSPLTFVDIGHLHSGLHVNANQIHAQGPMIGSNGMVTGGVVYTVNGGTANSGVSRITEKVDVHNKTTSAQSVLLAGFGYKSPQAALEVPDLSGLTVTGTTVVLFQGNTQTGSITDAPFGPLTVLPVVSFTGFNPLLNQSLSLPAGATLTMVTELKVERAPLLTVVTVVWLIALLVLGGAAALVMRRRRAAPPER